MKFKVGDYVKSTRSYPDYYSFDPCLGIIKELRTRSASIKVIHSYSLDDIENWKTRALWPYPMKRLEKASKQEIRQYKIKKLKE